MALWLIRLRTFLRTIRALVEPTSSQGTSSNGQLLASLPLGNHYALVCRDRKKSHQSRYSSSQGTTLVSPLEKYIEG